MLYRWLADAVVLLHGGFVLFVALGGLAVVGWPRAAWIHLPVLAWGVAIELGGWICPLTPLENRLRLLAGQAGYPGGFVEHYVISVLYPPGLTRGLQLALGLGVLALNLVVYAWALRRRGRARASSGR